MIDQDGKITSWEDNELKKNKINFEYQQQIIATRNEHAKVTQSMSNFRSNAADTQIMFF